MIAGVPLVVAVVVSSGVTIAYTLVGNMVAVAYTDILQLALIAMGLVRTAGLFRGAETKTIYLKIT